jgi:hypothetical protein
MRTVSLLVVIAALLPTSALAAKNPLGGPYIFFGGGAGPRAQDLGTEAPRPALRFGPTVELGFDLGPLHLAAGADLRFPIGVLAGNKTPTDLDLMVNLGLLAPTPLIRPFVRVRGGPGWEWTGDGRPDRAVVLGLDVGFRFRLPAAPVAFILSVAPTARLLPASLARSALDVEIRTGLAFP